MNIVLAEYGKDENLINVTSILFSLIMQADSNSKNVWQITNELMGGDPVFGTPKQLIIHYRYANVDTKDSIIEKVHFDEGSFIRFEIHSYPEKVFVRYIMF